MESPTVSPDGRSLEFWLSLHRASAFGYRAVVVLESFAQLVRKLTTASCSNDALSSSSCIWREQSTDAYRSQHTPAGVAAHVVYTSGHSADAVTQFVSPNLCSGGFCSSPTILRATIHARPRSNGQRECVWTGASKCVTRDPSSDRRIC